jgi:hypothetical protein
MFPTSPRLTGDRGRPSWKARWVGSCSPRGPPASLQTGQGSISVGGLPRGSLDVVERQCAADPLDRPHADPMRRCELHDAGLALP